MLSFAVPLKYNDTMLLFLANYSQKIFFKVTFDECPVYIFYASVNAALMQKFTDTTIDAPVG